MASNSSEKMSKLWFLVALVGIHLLCCEATADVKSSEDNHLKDSVIDKEKEPDTCNSGSDCSLVKESALSIENVETKKPDLKDSVAEKNGIPVSEMSNDKEEEAIESVDSLGAVTDGNVESAIENNAESSQVSEDEKQPVDISNSPLTTENKDDATGKDIEVEKADNDHATEKSNSSNSSAMYDWFKYFVDTFLEEFKEGSIIKQAEKENQTNTSDTGIALNESFALNITNVTSPNNITFNEDIQNATDTGKKTKFECIGRNVTDNLNATVKIINSAKLLQLLSFDKNDTENKTDCIVVMFYAPWCKFCAKTAPHFNALARAFPQLDFVAIDTAQFSNILARFGTVSVPNVLVFHQSRSTVKFNQTERVFPNFVSFLKNATGLEPNASVILTDEDYIGPVPSVPTDDPDYLLLVSWLFVIFCSTCMFIKSTKGQQCITRIRVLWQEHQHID